MPYRPRCESPEKYSADSRSVLLGTVPVLMQLPPGTPARSMTATRLPKYAACAPAFSPAGPQPMTIRSKESIRSPLLRLSPSRLNAVPPKTVPRGGDRIVFQDRRPDRLQL